MFLEVVGADGSKQAGNHLVSMKLGDSVLLDAGSASSLTNSEQMQIEVVLLTHAHLDHILELGFLADATVSQRKSPLTVIGSEASLSIVRKHYMNDLIWPDFSALDSGSGVSLDYRNMADEEWLELPGGLRALPVPVNHGAGARGFIFDSGRSTVAYTGDTGPTDRFWDVAAGCENLCMVIAEVSFPDRLTEVAIASDHLTPKLLEKEMHKLNRASIPIFAFHLKPWFRHEIERDLARRFRDRAVLLVRGDRFTF